MSHVTTCSRTLSPPYSHRGAEGPWGEMGAHAQTAPTLLVPPLQEALPAGGDYESPGP